MARGSPHFHAIHLRARLATCAILSGVQGARCNQLRGYTTDQTEHQGPPDGHCASTGFARGVGQAAWDDAPGLLGRANFVEGPDHEVPLGETQVRFPNGIRP